MKREVSIAYEVKGLIEWFGNPMFINQNEKESIPLPLDIKISVVDNGEVVLSNKKITKRTSPEIKYQKDLIMEMVFSSEDIKEFINLDVFSSLSKVYFQKYAQELDEKKDFASLTTYRCHYRRTVYRCFLDVETLHGVEGTSNI